MKKNFLKSDWFVALVVSIVFLLATNSDVLQSLERKAYDFGVQASTRDAGDQIAMIVIDDQSIANIGRWPWSREVHAAMFSKLASASPKVIGSTVYFLEPQVDPGLSYINQISDLVSSISALKEAPEATQLHSLLKEAKTSLNADAKLVTSIQQANNVILAMPFTLGEPRGNLDKPLPDFVRKNALVNIVNQVESEQHGQLPVPAMAAISPFAEVGKVALAIGHLNANPDVDGAIRAEPLVLSFYDQYYPSLSLQIAAKYLNLKSQDIQVRLGEGVVLGKLNISTDSALQMNTFFYSAKAGKSPFVADSFYDVLSGKIATEKYKDKIVLIGMAATGDGSDNQVTPISSSMKPIETLAHAVASILNEDFFVTPAWAVWVQLGAWLLVAIYLSILLPQLKARRAAMTTISFFAVLLALQFWLMAQKGLWLPLMMPVVLLVVGHAVLTTKQYFLTEQGKVKSDADSAESNRNLALMFQSQGQLDMAFDRFRKCPLDDGVMEGMYTLGLDFERKRQFNKAEAVFAHMAKHNPNYKDLAQRVSHARAMAETIIVGSGNARSNATTLMLNQEGIEKPMLGRYQVEKELGKGAMGVVYLGRDPKIGRVVAIKTMDLSQVFEDDALDEAKRRFFREAETAGKLNHPNIVTIYDAGEEHDLAYIAMEFLKGKDLTAYIKADHLLPLTTVAEIICKLADALDYAHAQHVVHRDVKPANVMYEPETGYVKMTDFGIARITDASKTRTGLILGTPSYMSPEQLSGKKIDGRSDLFSLGVMFYLLATGQLPFEGESMAALMFKITNEPQVSAHLVNPAVTPCLSAVIDRMLEKDIDQRYATGQEIVHDIKHCLQTG